MFKRKMACWGIIVQAKDFKGLAKDSLAYDSSGRVPRHLDTSWVLYGGKKSAERIKKEGKFYPEGKARVAPVIIEFREITEEELDAYSKKEEMKRANIARQKGRQTK